MDYSEHPGMWCGPNDGGIKRGDSAETGDNEARRNDGTGPGGSGVSGGDHGSGGNPTAVPSSLGADTGADEAYGETEMEVSSGTGGIDDLTILDASDPTLGLTDIGDIPPDDWAADTGPTHSAEEGSGLVEREGDPGGPEWRVNQQERVKPASPAKNASGSGDSTGGGSQGKGAPKKKPGR